MMEEIKSGLKNAIERGDSLEQAKQSFINAGYNPSEVEEAAARLTSGATQVTYPSAQEVKKATSSVTSPSFQHTGQQFSQSVQPVRPLPAMQQIQPAQNNAPSFPIPQQRPLPAMQQIQPRRESGNFGKIIFLVFLLIILLSLLGFAVYAAWFNQSLLNFLNF